MASLYISSLLAQKMNLRTLKKEKSALSSFWTWLNEKGHVDDNVWLGHPKGKSKVTKAGRKAAKKQKRPYTDDEMKLLLDDDAGETLKDAIRVLALHGCRANELAMITVGRCSDGLLKIEDAKTPAGVREVPIHSAAKVIIAKLCKGKKPDTITLCPNAPSSSPSISADIGSAWA